MTQEQDKTQAAGDEVKTERKRPGPKPKTAQSPVDDVKQSDQNATAKNSEETGNAGTETQASESASSSQTELEVEQQTNSAAGDQELDAEKVISALVDESKKVELVSTPSQNENPFLQAAGAQSNEHLMWIDEASFLPDVDVQTQQGGEEKNNEEIVVQKKAIHQRQNPFEVTVRNNGLNTIYEPSTKTSIKAGETVTIECPTHTVKQTVLGNIKQFKALGKNVEVLNGRS